LGEEGAIVRRLRGRLDGFPIAEDSVFFSGLELFQAGRGKSRDLPKLAQRRSELFHCYNGLMRIGLILGLAYFATLLCYREWRVTTRLLVTSTPWRTIARSAFNAFPTSRWRGITRIVGAPLAWYFAGMMLVLTALFLTGLEVITSPLAIYYSLVSLSRRCRGWFTQPPSHTPPHAAALAMSRPEPPSMVDAVSRIRIRR
jgi:hypothetical protein